MRDFSQSEGLDTSIGGLYHSAATYTALVTNFLMIEAPPTGLVALPDAAVGSAMDMGIAY